MEKTMSKEYSALSTQALNTCDHCHHPQLLPEVVHIDDPATNSLIDFQKVKPLVIHQEQRIYEARSAMENSTLHITFVTDDRNCLVGIITLEDILGSKPIRLQEELRIERKNLKVKHILIPMEKLAAVNYKDLKLAKIGHIVETLHQLNQHYLLVYEMDTAQQQRVRGIFLTSQLSKQFGTNVLSQSKPLSSLELQKKLIIMN